MDDFRLSRAQRNELAKLATDRSLALADFAWTDETYERTSLISKITHVPTGAVVKFAPTTHSAFWLEWWPNFTGTKPYASFEAWGAVKLFAGKWFDAVCLEHASPDLWSVAGEQRAWIAETPGASTNSPFTATERELLAQHLRTIEAFVVTTFNVTVEHQAEVRAQLKYLAEATERLGRFDWRGLAVSTLIGIVIQLGVTTSNATKVMDFAAQLLGPFVAGAAHLLQGH